MTLKIFLDKNMTKRRTKKDRLRVKLRNSSPKKLAKKDLLPKPEEGEVVKTLKISFQDPFFIKSDLKKTLLVTLFILLILFTIALLYT